MKALGLLPEDVADTGVTEIWGEHETSFQIFNKMSTQWRVGMNGPTGMDYGLLPEILNGMGITKPKARLGIIEELGVMENSALKTMTEGKK